MPVPDLRISPTGEKKPAVPVVQARPARGNPRRLGRKKVSAAWMRRPKPLNTLGFFRGSHLGKRE